MKEHEERAAVGVDALWLPRMFWVAVDAEGLAPSKAHRHDDGEAVRIVGGADDHG